MNHIPASEQVLWEYLMEKRTKPALQSILPSRYTKTKSHSHLQPLAR